MTRVGERGARDEGVIERSRYSTNLTDNALISFCTSYVTEIIHELGIL